MREVVGIMRVVGEDGFGHGSWVVGSWVVGSWVAS